MATRSKRWALIAIALCSAPLGAIEAPSPQASEQPLAAEPARAQIEPTDETAFYAKLQRVTHWRNLRDLKV